MTGYFVLYFDRNLESLEALSKLLDSHIIRCNNYQRKIDNFSKGLFSDIEVWKPALNHQSKIDDSINLKLMIQLSDELPRVHFKFFAADSFGNEVNEVIKASANPYLANPMLFGRSYIGFRFNPAYQTSTFIGILTIENLNPKVRFDLIEDFIIKLKPKFGFFINEVELSDLETEEIIEDFPIANPEHFIWRWAISANKNEVRPNRTFLGKDYSIMKLLKNPFQRLSDLTASDRVYFNEKIKLCLNNGMNKPFENYS